VTSVRDSTTSVLIVDDSVEYTAVLSKLLKGVFGYQQVTTVSSTADAYQLLKGHPGTFQLLFVDYRFPTGSTGGDFLERLSKEELLADKVAFLITSEPTVDNIKQARAAGAVGVVAKPFDREQLRLQLEKAERAIKTERESF